MYYKEDEYNIILNEEESGTDSKLFLGNRKALIKNFNDNNPLNLSAYVSALPTDYALETKSRIEKNDFKPKVT